jgi:ribosome-associated protein
VAGRERLRVTSSLAIPLEELQWRASGAGGPGGQHANTANTRVEVRFDVAGSPTLGPIQRSRLLARLGPTVRVVVSDERSQARNRQLALERLAARLAGALSVPSPRRPTRPTAASVRRRLDDKRLESDRKRRRRQDRSPGPDEE